MRNTCGSPLAWPTVRRGIGQGNGSLILLDGIEWINVYAGGDAIAGGRGLAAVAPSVRDGEVSNGIVEPHAVTRYLGTKPVAEAVERALE